MRDRHGRHRMSANGLKRWHGLANWRKNLLVESVTQIMGGQSGVAGQANALECIEHILWAFGVATLLVVKEVPPR